MFRTHPADRRSIGQRTALVGGGLVIAVSETLRADHAAPLREHALRLTGDESAATELVRRTFERAEQRPELVGRDPVAVRRWLFAVAGRLAGEAAGGPVRTEGDGDAVTVRSALAALHALPHRYKVVLVELHLRRRPAAEVAALLGLSPAALGVRSAEALRALRVALTDS
jgi:RNA polymerase sigma-70 factor (ECF subfamily)